MGVAISGWELAKAVASSGQMGVVSGTALAVTVARRLQLGDEGGHLRRAFDAFPVSEIADRVWAEYFLEGGKAEGVAFKGVPMPTLNPGRRFDELTVVANFVEVFLAKEGHQGLVGINLLEKIQLPTLPVLFGAMLAGVDYVLMGAGIPRSIPGMLDGLARGETVRLRVDVQGAASGRVYESVFDPSAFFEGRPLPELKRPQFLAIVSSATLAMTLAKKSNGRVDGFIVEGSTAGGHNAPPRGQMQLDELGQPIYGPRDEPELEKIKALGLPFWLAGSYGRQGRLAEALALGATGVQVGTAFAFCEESGLDLALKRRVVGLSSQGKVGIFTDPLASPTGFPFKVVSLEGTLHDAAKYEQSNGRSPCRWRETEPKHPRWDDGEEARGSVCAEMRSLSATVRWPSVEPSEGFCGLAGQHVHEGEDDVEEASFEKEEKKEWQPVGSLVPHGATSLLVMWEAPNHGFHIVRRSRVHPGLSP